MILKATVTIRDAKEQASSVIYYFDPADFPDYNPFEMQIGPVVEYLQELVKRMDAFILGSVPHISLALNVDLPVGIKTEPELNSDVEEKALFKFRGRNIVIGEDVFEARNYNQHVPTFDHSRFGDQKQIQASDDAEISYYTDLVTASTEAEDWSTAGNLVDYRGTDVANISDPIIEKKFKESVGA